MSADLSSLNILVTGGAGFIGSHLCERLLDSGAKVTCFDNLSSGKVKHISKLRRNKKFRLVRGDVLDFQAVKTVLKGIDVVYHLAARVGVKYYVDDPIDVLRTNVIGTYNMLEASRRMKLERFILASTSEVYGKNTNVPLTEESDRLLGPPQIDRWSYSTAKALDEHLCNAYHRKYGLPLVILRYFNSYGPRQDSSDYGGVVSIFMRRVLDNQSPQVHGDGQQTRSFMHVSDAIDGTANACERKGTVGHTFNLGNPVEVTILDLAKAVIKVGGRDGSLRPEFIPHDGFYGRWYEDTRRRVPDISMANRLLGFAPKITLEVGLQQTFDWYRKELAAASN